MALNSEGLEVRLPTPCFLSISLLSRACHFDQQSWLFLSWKIIFCSTAKLNAARIGYGVVVLAIENRKHQHLA
jgi:hypothetical protein